MYDFRDIARPSDEVNAIVRLAQPIPSDGLQGIEEDDVTELLESY